MEKGPEERGGGGLMIWAACGMVLCCALPVLLASGALSAAWAVLFDGSLGYWVLAGVLALAAGGVVLQNRSRAHRCEQFPESDLRNTGDRGVKYVEKPQSRQTPGPDE